MDGIEVGFEKPSRDITRDLGKGSWCRSIWYSPDSNWSWAIVAKIITISLVIL
jgi:hypothetical protein